MHGEKAWERKCQKPAVQQTTEEGEEEEDGMYVYILLARNKRTCSSAHNIITIDRIGMH